MKGSEMEEELRSVLFGSAFYRRPNGSLTRIEDSLADLAKAQGLVLVPVDQDGYQRLPAGTAAEWNEDE